MVRPAGTPRKSHRSGAAENPGKARWAATALLTTALLTTAVLLGGCSPDGLVAVAVTTTTEPAPRPPQAEIVEVIRPARIPVVDPGVPSTMPTSTAPADAPARMRLNVYCTARTDSIRTLVESLHLRMNQIPARLRDGDIAGAQADYDIARWASGDLDASVADVVARCETVAPRLTGYLQTVASQTRSTWAATRGACVSEYARRGIDCDGRHVEPGLEWHKYE